MRYQFAKRWLADLAIMPAANLGTAVKYGVPGTEPPAGTMDGMGARLTVDRTTDLSKRWRALYGAGYQAYGISYFSEGTGGVPVAGKEIRPPSDQANIFSALLRGGLEYKVKNRFRWSVMGQINQPRTVTCEMRIVSGSTEVGKVKVMELDMPVFVADTALTLYF